jgi:hypothetical protein
MNMHVKVPVKKYTAFVSLLVLIIVAGNTIYPVFHNAQALFNIQSVSLPPMTLTVAAPDGSQIALDEIDIGDLDNYRAYGGYKNQAGLLRGLGNYTGVPINTFCDMVGGLQNGYNVHIIASDGYTKIMTYGQVNGDLITYDNSTGVEVPHYQPLIPMLAYHYNDANVSSSDGPLRVAIVGPEGLCTQSTYWVKQVVRLEIHANLQPMNLTVVALNGTQLLLDETDISPLPAMRDVGAFRNQLGIVKGLGNYTGPALNAFLDLVGGMTSDNALRVTAVDNYTKTLSYDEVNGAFTTYDPVTGLPVPHNEILTPILGYHFNDANLSLADGPLRLAIVGSEGLATPSTYWVKQVVKLEIRYRDDVAVTNITLLKTAVGQGYQCDINVTVANQGGYTETFNVTLYANATLIATISGVALDPAESNTLTFTWNTATWTLGQYGLSASVTSVQDETDKADNSLTDGIIPVTVPGDVDGNFKVQLTDLVLLAVAYGAQPGDSKWNPNADLDNNGTVGLSDLVILAQHYGQTYP